jgi:hypothetical protein
VVQPTYVGANAGHYPLPAPIDGGDIATLAEALVQRIQWPKGRILIPPMTRDPNPEAATVSRDSVSKKRLNSSSRLAKLCGRSVDNSRRRSPGELCLSSSCNLRISNRRTTASPAAGASTTAGGAQANYA